MLHALRIEDFEKIRDEWELLLLASWTNTIFLAPWWQQAWWRHFGGEAELHLISVRRGDDILGVAPLMLANGTVSFLGDTDLFDYHDFLVRDDNHRDFFDVLLEYLLGLEWHTLDLRSLPQGSPTLRYAPSAVERKGLAVKIVQEDVAPVVALPATWHEYLAGLSKKSRHELRRKLRRLENVDRSQQFACKDPESISGYIQDFFRLLRASGEDKAAFLTPQRERFFRDIALDLAERGQFKLYFLEIAGVLVASCACFDYSGSYLLYNSGYDPAYSSLSVGLINKALCIREAIEEGRRSFDFLRGSERYKYDLGGNDRALYQMVVRR